MEPGLACVETDLSTARSHITETKANAGTVFEDQIPRRGVIALLRIGKDDTTSRQGDLGTDILRIGSPILRIGSPLAPFEILHLKRQRQRGTGCPLTSAGEQPAVVGDHGVVRSLQNSELPGGAVHPALAVAADGRIHVPTAEEAGLRSLTVRHSEP